MKESIFISVISYILAVVLIVVGVPLISEVLYSSFSEEISRGDHKKEYKVYHEYPELPSPSGKLTNENKLDGEVSESNSFGLDERTEGLLKRDKPIICIVIDDFGYSLEEYVVKAIKDLPITISIIPFLERSKEVYQIARRFGKEVILHIPMEAYRNEGNEKRYIRTSMSEEQIVSFLEEAFQEIDAEGINNHMGSKATEDERVMTAVISFLRKKNKFFLDSITTPNTVGMRKARECGMVPLKRDIFLDNYSTRYHILDQLENMEKIARTKGYCIAIGHARKGTLHTLAKWYHKNKDKYYFLSLGDLYKSLDFEKKKLGLKSAFPLLNCTTLH
ncbi:MAG: divergent polysaccharide deacetylase family protein [Brevinematia bacterium]